MSKNALLEAIDTYDAKFVDLRFTNARGKEQHITIPVSAVNNELIEHGKAIDGSSFPGWQKIHESDLSLIPDLSTVQFDPFYQDSTVFVRCNVYDPTTKLHYARCPRSIAQRAENYLKSTGIADESFFGPEPEFFIFDSVQYETSMGKVSYTLESEEAHWNSGKFIEGGNTGHRPRVKGGYFPVPPVDSSQDLRSAISLTLESLGIVVEAHHHEVATANQCEIATRFNSLCTKADEVQVLKYIIHNTAHNYGKTATFMPKPLVGDNGSGMHCHQSLSLKGVNLFAGDAGDGLSELALYYIGGIIKHARALNAFTNPATNSYKRLVPGFEAPVILAYSARNRSAAIRIPCVPNPKASRIEVRFPDGAANPYLAFAAMMMAGLDGIQNKIHPGKPNDKDLYELTPAELEGIPTVCSSLEQAIEHLEMDHEFLLKGDVFTQDFIKSYTSILKEDVAVVRRLVHPFEFELYYSV